MTAKVLRDIRTISQLDHPGIVRCYATWLETSPEGWQNNLYQDCAFVYIQLQWCEHTLEAWLAQNQTISSRPFSRMLEWFKPMICAVSYLHRKNIIQGDFQPSNIMFVDEDRLKISDIDVMAELEGDTKNEASLKRSPERFKSLPNNSKTDIFSLGLILAQLSDIIPMDQLEKV
ncbi:hypothetical protein PENTCL1PPCAC_8545, partial [Pristionchus entomophagus]